MPSYDTYYRRVAEDIAADIAEQQRTSPRAFALRKRCIDLYHSKPIGDSSGEMALRVVDHLNALINAGRDIDPPYEANLMGSLGLLR